MLFSARRADDADVIRARLRALLDEGAGRRGWLPDDDPDQESGSRDTTSTDHPWQDDDEPDSWSAEPAEPGRPSPAPAGNGRHRAAGPSTRVDPGPHGARTLWLVAVLAAVAVVGWSWWGRPDVEPVPGGSTSSALPAASTGVPVDTDAPATDPAPTPAVVVVAVVGQVVSPGVVTLPAGSRVADALAAAGGLLPEADPAAINAAALLTDGQQIAVGVPGAGGGTSGAADSGAAGSTAAAGLVDLNTATLADLDGLPGIGPVLAQRILDHRDAHGPFTSVEQLDDVSGIGPSLYAEVSPLVTV